MRQTRYCWMTAHVKPYAMQLVHQLFHLGFHFFRIVIVVVSYNHCKLLLLLIIQVNTAIFPNTYHYTQQYDDALGKKLTMFAYLLMYGLSNYVAHNQSSICTQSLHLFLCVFSKSIVFKLFVCGLLLLAVHAQYEMLTNTMYIAGPSGELRQYLLQLADADNVQLFVAQNPFGQPAIREGHPEWDFYKQIAKCRPQQPTDV